MEQLRRMMCHEPQDGGLASPCQIQFLTVYVEVLGNTSSQTQFCGTGDRADRSQLGHRRPRGARPALNKSRFNQLNMNMLRHFRVLTLRPMFGFAETPAKQQAKPQQAKAIQTYKEGQIITKNYLQLKKTQDIEGYVVALFRNYYRTTNKGGLTLDSSLQDHGLDSLDSIELSMQIEEDLGYVISAETLPVLNKVKHYVNYINQVEQFKVEAQKAPLP